MKRLRSLPIVCALLAPFVCDAISAQNTITIVGRNYVFDVPDSIPAGLAIFDFRNLSDETHEAILKRIPAGHTMLEVFAATEGIPSWVQPAGGPNVIDAGGAARVLQRLEPGTYFWLCVIAAPDGKSHKDKGMMHRMVVTAPRPNTVKTLEPTTATTILLKDFTFGFTAPVKRGEQWIRVDNKGVKPHEVVIFRLAPGKTLADANAWKKKDGPEPFTRIGGLATVPAGAHAFIRFAGEPGTYVLRCRIPDSATGKTHRQLGMEMEFKVE